MIPDTIMIFAAGRGTRMRELTKDVPKPMLPVAEKPMIDRALEIANNAKIERKVINTHYKSEVLEKHLYERDSVFLSTEKDQLLETGGGLKYALPLLGSNPVFTLNPDAIFLGENPLVQLASAWDSKKMDALLLLVPLLRAEGYQGDGDFSFGPDNTLQRFAKGNGTPMVYTGVQIVKTERYRQIDQHHFSHNLIWNQMLEEGKLFGRTYSGAWVDVGTPEGIIRAEEIMDACGNV